MLHTFIIAWHDTLDGHRTAVIAVQDTVEEGALAQARTYFADWGFHEEEYLVVSVTMLPETITAPVYVALGD
jgi:hypothetical protein